MAITSDLTKEKDKLISKIYLKVDEDFKKLKETDKKTYNTINAKLINKSNEEKINIIADGIKYNLANNKNTKDNYNNYNQILEAINQLNSLS